MLDYKALKAKFSEKLKEFDKNKLAEWISYDQKRDLIDFLGNGEIVEKMPKTATTHLAHCKAPVKVETDGNVQYAMAA